MHYPQNQSSHPFSVSPKAYPVKSDRVADRRDTPARHVCRCRFTLIELLVVIAIIAILASMLLPTLQRARESGKNVSCINNMKQIGSMLLQYTNTYADYCPPLTANYQGVNVGWNMIFAESGFKECNGPTLVCPNWNILPPGSSLFSSSFETKIKYDWNRVYYGYNQFLANNATGDSKFPKNKINRIYRPSSLIAFAEIASTGGYYYTTGLDYGGSSTTQPARYNWMVGRSRHLGGSNYIFADGHVAHFKAPNPWFGQARNQGGIDTSGDSKTAKARFSPVLY